MSEGAEAIAAARTLLPGWVGWGGIALVAAAGFVLSLLAAWVAGRTALLFAGRARDHSWTARAARLYPVRRALRVTVVVCAATFAVLGAERHGPLDALPLPHAAWLGALPAALGASLVPRVLRRALGDPPRGSWWRNFAFGALALFPHALVLALVAVTIPTRPTPAALAVLAAGALALLAVVRGGGIVLLRLFGGVNAPPPRLERAVAAASERIGAAAPPVAVAETSIPNAFALPGTGQVLFTRRALDVLDDDEIEALALHEIGHLREGPRARLARAAGVFLVLPVGALPLVIGTAGLPGFAAVLALVILAAIFLRRMRARGEQAADAVAHGHAVDRAVYARALERLHEAAGIPAVGRGRGAVHGHLYDRMLAAGVTPDYPRPDPPRSLPGLAGTIAGALALASLTLAALLGVTRATRSLPYDETGTLARLALRGARAADVAHLATLRQTEQRHDEAAVFLAAAAALDPRALEYPARLASLLAVRGRCDEAWQALHEAELRAAAGATDAAWTGGVIETAWRTVETLCP